MDDSNADLATRAGWLRTAAGHHTKLANRLINVARTMKTRASSKAKAEEKLRTNEVTMRAYKELAERGSKQENLSDKQKAIIREGWKRKRERKKTGAAHKPEKEEDSWMNIFNEIQTFGMEMKQSLEMIMLCDLTNVIHSAKMTRQGEAHKKLAQVYFAEAKGEVQTAIKIRNSSGNDGGKHLSAAIVEQA